MESSKLAQALLRRAGAAVAVVEGEAVEVVTLGSGVDTTTRVEVGSVTKAFTGMLLADAVDRGDLQLESRVDELVFGERWAGRPAITAGQLAAHLSGLPRLSLPPWRWLHTNPYAGYTRGDLQEYLRRKQPRSPSEPKYRYSNLGYAVLGLMLEKAAGRSFADLLRERLLDPLRMASTRLQSGEGPIWSSRGFRRYRWNIPLWQYRLRPRVWRFDAYAPCGALASTLDDLVRALRGFLDPNHSVAPVLDRSAQPLMEIPGGTIGMAWHAPAGGEWIWHNGATYGHAAYLGVGRRKDVGVAIVCNQSAPRPVTELGHQLMRHLVKAS